MDIFAMPSSTLHEQITKHLTEKLAQLTRKRDKSLHVYQHSQSDYTYSQYLYDEHAVCTVKWLIRQVPKRFHDVVVVTPLDVAEMIDASLANMIGDR